MSRRRRLEGAWRDALEHFPETIHLSAPEGCDGGPLVALEPRGRCLRVNMEAVERLGLEHCLEALLTHELTRLTRVPGSSAALARMTLLTRRLLGPTEAPLVALFCDLQIADQLSRHPDLRQPLLDVRAATRPAQAPDLIALQRAVYEEQQLAPPGSLMPHDCADFERRHPDYRADARLLARELPARAPRTYTQLVLYLCIARRYLGAATDSDGAAAPSLGAESGSAGGALEPSDDEWAQALSPDARERRALEEAAEEGWLEDAEAGEPDDSFDSALGAASTGSGAGQSVPRIMAAWYRQQAERYLVRPPPVRTRGEALVPTTLRDWEPGEPLHRVDWAASFRERGLELGAAMPLEREILADEEGIAVPRWQPRMEIYLDVSGSMPDPCQRRNAMTLAAQILVTGTVRAGGWVRTVLYSDQVLEHWTWTRSNVAVSRFLMRYLGGGTMFPFERLRASLEETRAEPPVRVVISDQDFDMNVTSQRQHALIREAADDSAALLLLLHRAARKGSPDYAALGARVVPVLDFEDFPQVAADLAHALFDAEPAP